MRKSFRKCRLKEKSNCYSTRQAAEYLGASPFTLKGWRRRGEGPPWIKLSPRLVVYERPDLDAYKDVHKQTTRNSSSVSSKGGADDLSG